MIENIMPMTTRKPKDVRFMKGKVYKGSGYTYNKFTLVASGKDLHIRAQGRGADTVYLKIADYADTTPAQIMHNQAVLGGTMSIPLESAIMDFYHSNGLQLGFVQR